MNELASLGLILLFALLAGHLVRFVRVPEVTGYLLAGIAVGPSGLQWITHENLTSLGIFSEVALGLILFSLGAVFEFERFRTLGATALRITTTDSFAAALLVFVVMLAAGLPLPAAVLLGVIAMETAAASTLMVMRECNSEGPLTDTLTAMIGVNNIVCLLSFSVAAGAISLVSAEGGVLSNLYTAIYPLVWQILGSVALGYLVGLLLASWATRVDEHGEMLILLIGSVLLCVGLALVLELSSMIASLAVGATMSNLSANSRRLFQTLSQTDPPLYAIFFVIAGAELDLSLLKSIGWLGVAYLVARAAGKIAGSRVATIGTNVPMQVRKLLGFSVLSHAGLAIGLTLVIGRRFPELAPQVNTVVLSAVILYEMFGPLATRLSLDRAGEVRERAHAPIGILD